MGYRTYVGSLPKKEYNKIKSLTKEELIKFYNIEVDGDGDWYKGDVIESPKRIVPEIKLTTDGKKVDTLYIYKLK